MCGELGEVPPRLKQLPVVRAFVCLPNLVDLHLFENPVLSKLVPPLQYVHVAVFLE